MNAHLTILSGKFVTAFGWTLLHSLWQGALVSVVLGLTLILLKKHSAAVRYFAAVTAMATLFVMSVATFYHCYPTATTPHTTSRFTVEKTLTTPETLSMLPQSAAWAPSLTDFTTYFEPHFPLMAIGWLLGVLVLILRFMGAFSYVLRLRNYKVTDAPEAWQLRVNFLAQQLDLTRSVRLLESALAKVPMTIGYLKPVILMPIGTLTGLAPAQVEAVLAHELAHICRHDYLVNLLQSCIEILFFYHPATWWLSARVRQEREHCCDDIAIALSGDTVTFARALMKLEEYNGQTPAIALGATGANGVLLGRIKRLLTGSKRAPSFTEGLMAAGILLIGALMVSTSTLARINGGIRTMLDGSVVQPASALLPGIPKPMQHEKNAFFVQLQDSTNRRSDVIIVKDKKGNITELYVNGKRIPVGTIKNYRARIEEALDAQRYAHTSEDPDEDVTDEDAEEDRRISRRDESWNWEVSGSFRMPEPPIPPAPAVHPAPEPFIPPLPPMPELDELQLKVDIQQDIDIEVDEPEAEEAMEELHENIQELNRDIQQRTRALQGLARESGRRADFRKEMEHIEEELRALQDELEQAHQELNEKSREIGRQHNERMREVARSRERHKEQVEGRLHEVNRQRQEVWARQHEAKMKVHAEQMEEHAVRMKEHGDRMAKHGRMFDALENQLVRDGFMRKGANFEFKMENQTLEINGETQPEAVYQRYVELLDEKGEDVFDKKPGERDFKLHMQRQD